MTRPKKLTPEQERAIVDRFVKGDITVKSLAHEFNISTYLATSTLQWYSVNIPARRFAETN